MSELETEGKSNPYITKSISKSLLTPCRRVGLSRKKQTPNSSLNSYSESVNKTVCSDSETALLNANLSSNIRSKENSTQPAEVSNRKKSKISKRLLGEPSTDLSQTLINQKTSDLTNSLELNSDYKLKVCSKEDRKNIDLVDNNDRKYVNKKKAQVFDSDNDNKKGRKTIHKDVNDKRETKASKRRSDSDDENFRLCKRQTHCSFHLESNVRKKIPSIEDEGLLQDKINETQIKKSDEKTKKIRRSLSMKKSSEDKMLKKPMTSDGLTMRECLVSLSPLRTQITEDSSVSLKTLPDETQNIEKMVKEKIKIVADLRQSEIYQKKHDVQEIKKLTILWKSGCIAALNDLLPHLRKHADIDMATLLKNLRVPENLITLSQSGELI